MTPNTAWSGPWIARFNGYHHGSERHWAVGPVWQEIRLAPVPQRKAWFVSGGDGIPPGKASERWPGEIRYVLRSTKHVRVQGEDVVVAQYQQRPLEDAPVPAR